MPNPFAKYVASGEAPQEGQAAATGEPSNPFSKYSAVAQAEPAAPQQSTFMDALTVFNQKFQSMAEGGLQKAYEGMAAVGIDTSSWQKKLAGVHAQNKANADQAMKNSPTAGMISGVLGDIGAGTAFTGGMGGGGATALAKIGSLGVASGVAGGLGYAEEGESSFEKGMNSGVMGAALGGGLLGLGKIASYITPKLFSRPVQEAADEINAGGIMTAGQATGSDAIQNMERGLSKIPLVGGKKNIKNASDNILEQTNKVLNKAGVDDNTVQEVVGQKLNESLQGAKSIATTKTDAAYKDALDIAKTVTDKIPLTNSQALLSEVGNSLDNIAKEGYESILPQSTKIKSLVKDFNVEEGVVKTISPKHFEDLRKTINGISTTLKKGADDQEFIPVLGKLKDALDADLGEFSNKAGGAMKSAYEKARSVYMTEKLPFKNDVDLKAITSEGLNSDKLLNMVIKNNAPQLTRKVYGVLPDEGKQLFTTAIVNKVATDSIKDGMGTINLEIFSKSLNSLKGTLNAMPEGIQLQLKGLQQTLKYGKNTINAATHTPSGLIGGFTGAGAYMGAIHNPLITAGAAITLKSISSLLTNPGMVKRLVKVAGGTLKEHAYIKESILKELLKAPGRSIPAGIKTYAGAKAGGLLSQ